MQIMLIKYILNKAKLKNKNLTSGLTHTCMFLWHKAQAGIFPLILLSDFHVNMKHMPDHLVHLEPISILKLSCSAYHWFQWLHWFAGFKAVDVVAIKTVSRWCHSFIHQTAVRDVYYFRNDELINQCLNIFSFSSSVTSTGWRICKTNFLSLTTNY